MLKTSTTETQLTKIMKAEQLKLHNIYLEISKLLMEVNGETNQHVSPERRKEISENLRELARVAMWLGPVCIKVAPEDPKQEGVRFVVHPKLLKHLSPENFAAIYTNGWEAKA